MAHTVDKLKINTRLPVPKYVFAESHEQRIFLKQGMVWRWWSFHITNYCEINLTMQSSNGFRWRKLVDIPRKGQMISYITSDIAVILCGFLEMLATRFPSIAIEDYSYIPIFVKLTFLGVGVTKPISSVSLFSKFVSIVKTHFSYWLSR